MCVCSPQPADSETVVQFDGEGYAAVSRPIRWNPNSSTVTFKFRTFSTSAVMMYLATKDMVTHTHTHNNKNTHNTHTQPSQNSVSLSLSEQKDFMSIELSEGRVKVSYDLGSGTGSALSQKRHNDGRWKSLTMTRSKKEGNRHCYVSPKRLRTRKYNTVLEEQSQCSSLSRSTTHPLSHVLHRLSGTVLILDMDTNEEETLLVDSQGGATGLNLKEGERIYFGGLPTIGNYR